MAIEFLESPLSESSSEGSTSPYEASLQFTPLTTPRTSPSPEPCAQKNEGLFSSPFFPASLDDPTRDGPVLPKALPQLLPNVTPLEVAEAVKHLHIIAPSALITFDAGPRDTR